MEKQRVLFISPQPFFEWRGSSIRVKFTVMALAELGYDTDLLTLPIGEDDPDVNVNVIRVWNVFNSKTISIGPSLLKLWFDFLLLIKGSYLVLTRRYDVLHGTEEAGSICWFLSLLCRAKSIYEKHSDSNSYRDNKSKPKEWILNAYSWLEGHTIRKSNLVIATGPSLASQAKEYGDNAPVVAIPDIPSSRLEPDPKEVQKKRVSIQNHENEILVTYVGSFASYQGIDMVFDCMANVVHENPYVRFLIIGGSTEEIKQYRQQLEAQGLNTKGPGGQVDFLGKIDPDELTLYLAASDILLVPRKSGINSPLKILDFFKAGRAIVATDTDANRRLLDHENAELSPFDSSAFGKAILSLSINPQKREQLAANGHEAYKRQYNFSVFKKQIQAAYELL